MLYTMTQAESLRCPYVDKNCETEKCIAWEVVSNFDDIIYENSSTIEESTKIKLEKDGYFPLPAHGIGLELKKYFPMTEDEINKARGNTYGTQLFFGRKTEDKTKWFGRCSCLNKGE